MSSFQPTIEMLRAMLPFLMSTAAALSGYDIMKRTGLSKQTSYSVMHKLTREGWLNSKTERSNLRMGYRPRKLYEMTAYGAGETRATLDLLRPST
jgi:DNA-binding PadR family transcriptional regulator